ncbi:phage holin family protein [Bacillus subtilis]|uniref:phage holin family protein n=1 Tax=Pseudochrobactrum asaccharolyticum TaxID=354351 RepID=UPI001F1EAE89|nr:phage holin family protein [Pseudochrobactrum asaccharolyticum]MCF7646269.1 phage holin family protein [Pseudochrobactrum asaccharolyticum]MCF7673016.1 phage holin family protein [Bacillus subtilis]
MLKLFTPVISAIIGSEVQAATQRAKRSAILYTIMAVALLTGTFFLLMALFFALMMHFGLIIAALIITAGCVVLAILAFIINRVMDNAEKRRLEDRRAAIDTNAALTAAAVAAVPTLLKKPLLTLALPVAGLLAVSLLSKDKKSDSTPKKDQGS